MKGFPSSLLKRREGFSVFSFGEDVKGFLSSLLEGREEFPSSLLERT